MLADYAEAIGRHRFDLLYTSSKLTGLIETVEEEDMLLIVNLAVRPGAQGRGFGTQLIAHADRLAAEAGLRGVRLYTNQRFTDNISLYASLGYRQVRTEVLDRGIVVHMIKLLTG